MLSPFIFAKWDASLCALCLSFPAVDCVHPRWNQRSMLQKPKRISQQNGSNLFSFSKCIFGIYFCRFWLGPIGQRGAYAAKMGGALPAALPDPLPLYLPRNTTADSAFPPVEEAIDEACPLRNTDQTSSSRPWENCNLSP